MGRGQEQVGSGDLVRWRVLNIGGIEVRIHRH
jgi:hypothetical protein